MTRRFPALAAVWLSTLVVAAAEARQAAPERQPARPVTQSAALPFGTLTGMVTDPAGRPVAGATVAAEGATIAVAVTGRDGRFVLAALPPGPYSIHAFRPGYATSRRDLVSLGPHSRLSRGFVLKPLTNVESLTAAETAERERAAPPAVAAAAAQAATAEPGEPDEEAREETRWRVRHLRRSVLRSVTVGELVAGAADRDDDSPGLGGPWLAGLLVSRAVESSARFAANLFDGTAWSGQINLLTTTSFDRPGDLFGAPGWPRGVAYLALGAPAGSSGEWTIRGAMTSGDVASWVVAGAYTASTLPRHAVVAALSYSTQRYEGGNPAALAAVRAGARNVGAVSVFDSWALSPALSLDYGGQYAWYDYMERAGLFSPRAALTMTPVPGTRVRLQVSQQGLAPGAEEFLPPESAGPWLPPERTFAPLPGSGPFRAERTRQLEVALERDLTETASVRVRRLQQRTSDQLVTLFGLVPTGTPSFDLGHYYVASLGNVEASGWGLGVTRRIGSVRGSVEYHVWQTRWRSLETATARLVSGTRGEERLHDLTTALETDVPVVDTEIVVVCRVNSAFAGNDGSRSTRVDSRFDVQVRQPLPALTAGSEWEVLVGVRNLFREPQSGASVLDELLVIRPPKRIVGGLLVRF